MDEQLLNSPMCHQRELGNVSSNNNHNIIFICAYFKPVTVVSTWHLLSHLIPMTNLWSKHYYSILRWQKGNLESLSNHLKSPIK